MNWFSRSEMLIKKENVEKLKNSKVVVVGLGGVGGSCAEALCRGSIGNLMIVDNDTIDVTNINRQVIALHSNIGESKTTEFFKRLKQINPEINLVLKNEFCLPQNSDFIFEYQPDYIVDAIDTIATKISLAKMANEKKINFISCMGMGNRLDPSLIRYGTIQDTRGTGCAVSRVVRSKLKKFDLFDVNVVFSLEPPKKLTVLKSDERRYPPASFSCVPPVAGYFLASKVIRDLIDNLP